MGINYIGRTVKLNPTPATTIDLDPIDVQAGDLLLFGTGYGLGTYSRPSSIVDVGTGTVVFTRSPGIASGLTNQGLIGYVLNCPLTATGVVFRVTWSSAPTAIDMAFVEVWRPTAGVTMQLDASPTFVTGTSTTPTSPLITTTTRALVWSLCMGGASIDKTSPLIGGLTADMYPASPNTSPFTSRLALAFATAQTNITAVQTFASSASWAFGAYAFREYSTSVNQTITCTGITLGGTSTTQEVFVGGIG